MRRPRPLLVLVLAALAIGGAAGTASAGPIEDLLARYRSVAGRHDDAGYEVQREALDQIADLRTEAARKALRGVYAEEKNGDRRRVVLILAALVRQGGPEEVDFAVRAAEASRDPVLVESLARVFAAARREEAKA
jgi:hypothetical protein